MNADSESALLIHRTYLGREKFPKKRSNNDQLGVPGVEPSCWWTPTEYVRCINSTSFDPELNADSESARLIHRTYLGGEKFPKKRPKFDRLDVPGVEPSCWWTPTEYVRCMNCSSFDAELNADSESARSIHRTYLGREKFPKKKPKFDQLDVPGVEPSCWWTLGMQRTRTFGFGPQSSGSVSEFGFGFGFGPQSSGSVLSQSFLVPL